MGCGEFFVKYLLFFSNLFFALAGLALVGVGIAVELQLSAVLQVISEDPNLQIAPITSIVVGSVVFFIAFFGCCGAIRESNCMLVTYSMFLIILMVVKVALATLIFIKLDSIVAGTPGWLNEAFTRNQEGFYEIQRTFQCCGTSSSLVYPVGSALPDTCCPANASACTVLNAYDGCNQAVANFFNTFGMVIGMVAIVVGAIELVAVVFGLCLANHVRNKYRRSRY